MPTTKPAQVVGGQIFELCSLATERDARMADDYVDRAGQNNHRWNPEADDAVCRVKRLKGKAFTDVIILWSQT